mmetsp:Transcript_11520/g.40223  ORF Transcript_11520/g.40223 Transcript_11520/m.40223 type:complete len:252 (-) Transcript_11520:2758-3513(-)
MSSVTTGSPSARTIRTHNGRRRRMSWASRESSDAVAEAVMSTAMSAAKRLLRTKPACSRATRRASATLPRCPLLASPPFAKQSTNSRRAFSRRSTRHTSHACPAVGFASPGSLEVATAKEVPLASVADAAGVLAAGPSPVACLGAPTAPTSARTACAQTAGASRRSSKKASRAFATPLSRYSKAVTPRRDASALRRSRRARPAAALSLALNNLAPMSRSSRKTPLTGALAATELCPPAGSDADGSGDSADR